MTSTQQLAEDDRNIPFEDESPPVTLLDMCHTPSTPLYLGEELRKRAESFARCDGVSLSAWVRQAIIERIERDERLRDGRAAMREWEAEDGPIPPEVRERARRELEEAGVIPPREQP